jgi:hypothetical protein
LSRVGEADGARPSATARRPSPREGDGLDNDITNNCEARRHEIEVDGISPSPNIGCDLLARLTVAPRRAHECRGRTTGFSG